MLAVAAALLALAACAGAPPDEAVIGVERQPEGYLVSESGRPVLFYQLEPRSFQGRYERSNYVHPLYGLDGEVLTEDFPEDHRHHRGVFWAWHQVLVGEARAGDAWLTDRFSWRLAEERILPEGNGLRLRHQWHSPDVPDGADPILEETVELVVHPQDAGFRLVDFDIRLTPLREGVRLGGSEDDKGYGGFSVRLRTVPDLRFTGADGPVEPARGPVDAGDWVDFAGGFGAPGAASGVAVLVHPSSAGYPQEWILRSPATPSMQNPVWPGREPEALPPGRDVRLRYRLVVHRGDASEIDLDGLSEAYAALR